MFSKRRLSGLGCAAAWFCIICGNVSAQPSLPGTDLARSVSGQFIVTSDPSGPPGWLLAALPGAATNTDVVRLEPALLAVSAERIRQQLWRELGISSKSPWRGKIFLVLGPARSFDDNVTVVSEHFADGWDYRVTLPDVLPRIRYLRALTGVVLLEYANRSGGMRSAEVPAWLTDGLSQQLLTTGTVEIVLSSPGLTVNGLWESRTSASQRGIDPLAAAREVLQDHSALTFEQLCWPTDGQVSGMDGGVYRASAQLFVNDLLKLKDGPQNVRAMLQTSPHYLNWQTAFQNAFRADFAQPLDVEKWWALQVIGFAAHDPGPTWTPAASREKLDEILSVAVDFRTGSNSLPVYTKVSLQAVIRNFDSARQTEILSTKLRDLELAELRVARLLAPLTAGYRDVLAAYLGQSRPATLTPAGGRYSSSVPPRASARDTLGKLDALDAQRRLVESSIKPDIWRP
ncbi:MAG TPA: hypothetical protein VMJ12_07130 [Candidatus Acidoferrales bacterium]|nr:hypothetical protein [Candidatus Acidoferrales bacterium]